MPLDISILIATYNRAPVLAETLTAMTALDRTGIQACWIVVDNNSTDATPQVVQIFQQQLPLQYLFEPRAGKNCALNKALREGELGEILVFTDDDITPALDWLQQIVRACDRQTNYAVFGGKLSVRWPRGKSPNWAQSPFVQSFGFGAHDQGEIAKPYAGRPYPFGGNLWIRKSVLQGRFYDERFGPRPKGRVMGSETSLLLGLATDGVKMLYWPFAVVEHRVGTAECHISTILRRSFRYGRGLQRQLGVRDAELLARSKPLWSALQGSKCLVTLLKCFTLVTRPRSAVQSAISYLVQFGRLTESLRIGLANRGSASPAS